MSSVSFSFIRNVLFDRKERVTSFSASASGYVTMIFVETADDNFPTACALSRALALSVRSIEWDFL